MTKHNLIAALALTLVASGSFAQESFTPKQNSSNTLSNTSVITVNPDAVLNLQLSGQASDPIEALGQIADELANKYGLQVHKEIVGGQFALIVSGNINASVQQEENVLATQSLSGKQEQFAPLRINSVSCTPTGLADLVQCQASVSGGTPAYRFNWQAANSSVSATGSVAFIFSCAQSPAPESVRLAVTDSAGATALRHFSVACVNNPF